MANLILFLEHRHLPFPFPLSNPFLFISFILHSEFAVLYFYPVFFSFERREENVHFILCVFTVRLVGMWWKE